MSDETQIVPVKKEVEEIAVRNPHNTGFNTLLKGPDGRFVKKKKRLEDPKELKKAMYNLMLMGEADQNGKLIKGSTTRWRKIFDACYETAKYCGTLDEKGNRIFDSKMSLVAFQAQKFLIQQFTGKEPMAPEEVEALKESAGIKVLIVQTPELMNKDVIDERKAAPTKPSFAEVVEIVTNEKE